MNSTTKDEFYMTELLQMVVALIISIIQTKRIMNTTKKYERFSLSIKGIGIVLAGGGTLIILKKLKDGMKLIKDTNSIVKRKY